MSETTTPKPIAHALADVMRSVGGVAKRDRNNTGGGFNFRGIDAVLNAVGPALREHGVIVTPDVRSIDYTPVTVGARSTTMTSCRVVVAYTFHGPAGDTITASTAGEAFDAGDKATSKAMSVAFRTALIQALALPTDEPDPDHDTYQQSAAPSPQDHAHRLATVARDAADLDALRAVYREADARNVLALPTPAGQPLGDYLNTRAAELAPPAAEGEQPA